MEQVIPVGRRWQPGQSGNPNGRRPGLAVLVRRSTRNGRELVHYLLAVVRDTGAKPRDRLEAVKLLLERGWGRTQAVVDPLFAHEAVTEQSDQRTPLEVIREIIAAADEADAL
jgi:hypothetical protein